MGIIFGKGFDPDEFEKHWEKTKLFFNVLFGILFVCGSVLLVLSIFALLLEAGKNG